mmetsp:Transcript_11427/g.18983  ORF Transcript_11427/g.18983 Transcript_11427/m.18983 type:complete len:216 (-) Transcript_11427:214-861(-)
MNWESYRLVILPFALSLYCSIVTLRVVPPSGILIPLRQNRWFLMSMMKAAAMKKPLMSSRKHPTITRISTASRLPRLVFILMMAIMMMMMMTTQLLLFVLRGIRIMWLAKCRGRVVGAVLSYSQYHIINTLDWWPIHQWEAILFRGDSNHKVPNHHWRLLAWVHGQTNTATNRDQNDECRIQLGVGLNPCGCEHRQTKPFFVFVTCVCVRMRVSK